MLQIHITHRKLTPSAALEMTFRGMLLYIKHVLKTTICPLPRAVQVSFGYAAAVVSRVLSYQLTYFLSSQPLGPVYKPLPAEDVEYGAWKIDGHSPQLANNRNAVAFR